MTKTFGLSSKGDTVQAVTLSAGDLSVTILTWGAIVQDVRLAGVPYSLTLGSDYLSDYEGDMMHHGSLIGPIANRISTARVRIGGMMYELERNQDGRIHLHSGKDATHRRNWTLISATNDTAVLECTLPDGTCGLPGNRVITATYRVSAPATLDLTVTGTTDDTTMMNFANHSYWNLDGSATYDGHRLQINADRYLPGTQDNVPTGEIAKVAGTPMDFRAPRKVAVNDPPFDNNFCLSDTPQPRRDALVLTGANGVQMTVATNQTGIQIYDARDAIRPDGTNYEGLAIEAQGWPDAPTHRDFPSILVSPDAPYHQETQFRFQRITPTAT